MTVGKSYIVDPFQTSIESGGYAFEVVQETSNIRAYQGPPDKTQSPKIFKQLEQQFVSLSKRSNSEIGRFYENVYKIYHWHYVYYKKH